MARFDGDFTLTIDGKGVSAPDTIDVVNPANGEVVAQVPDCTAEQLDQAVEAARRAFPAWRATPLAQRRAAVAKFAEVLAVHAQEFARLFTLEQGRPVDKAAQEIMGAAFWCQTVSQQEIPVIVNEDSAERRSETRHVPIGVVGGIVPWNFPMLLGVWKIAPALLTGNTIVVKPSPFTPLTMLKLAELMREHLPPGVFNVVSGGDRLGPWLTAHPGIDKVSFTGSTATGRRVMESASANLKRLTLELGGNDAAIVLPDVDVKEVAEKLFWAAFGNSGQICVATKRMYVHKDVYDAVAQALVETARKMKVGNGLEQGTDLGPVQNRVQYERVKDLIEDAKSSGLKFLVGGEVPEGKGYFLPVTIVDNPPEDSRVVQEEAFGPVLPLLKFDTVDEAVARANASEYGLAGSVWSGDVDRAVEIAARLETGTVWINEAQYIMPWTPFGGHKQSGVGIENGADGLLEYTNPQTISFRKAAAGARG
ncbi:aldehyde dehydrogenase family protein [Sphingobium chlorophenolicum]|uniref:Aldehyde Dehydrogenase n=1 Tax=Sphingobium chlorophenolicum TaxID=46429 RepID=A0A081RBR9_SPHCR|nr:aldehyde dehydrogenase family protein [Sphingobium chlorophenolicum]KEQ52642.1 Aldehyde Dehydrogenase [Sphingobium chlorophenolicum]